MSKQVTSSSFLTTLIGGTTLLLILLIFQGIPMFLKYLWKKIEKLMLWD